MTNITTNITRVKMLGGACALAMGLLAAAPASAAVFQFDEGLAFNKERNLAPSGFNFSVLHTASGPFSAGGQTTHTLRTNVDPNTLPNGASGDLDPRFRDNLGGSFSYVIDNGAGGNADITAQGALDGATMTIGENRFIFNGTGGNPDGILTLRGALDITSAQRAFDDNNDVVATPFGLARPQYQLTGVLGFYFQTRTTTLTGRMNLMPGTMGPFNGLAVGTRSRPEDVTMYLWAASAEAMDCHCDFNRRHFALDMALWGTQANNVPEPGALALIGAGLGGIGFVRKRRQA